ncbi:MAG: hypothetical protein HYX32_07850 [Actinobacteria bacterium]|nr:hypothetical protein [Actinomycetota bacterium]
MANIDRAQPDAVLRVIDQRSDVLFTWDYERSRPALVKLYEKAKTSPWNASDQLDWSIEVDPEKVASGSAAANNRFNFLRTEPDSLLRSWRQGVGPVRHRDADLRVLPVPPTANMAR